MKYIFPLVVMLFGTVTMPLPAHAQVPFGGLIVMDIPCICEPPNIPIEPPLFIMHILGMFYNNSLGPIVTSLLTATEEELLYPPYYMHAGAWALGYYTPGTMICGFVYLPPAPPFPGLCIPWGGPIIGFVDPNTALSN